MKTVEVAKRSALAPFQSSLDLPPSVVREVVAMRRPFTAVEYHKMAQAGILRDDERVELIAGEVIRKVPIGPGHGGHVNKLTQLFVQRFAGRAVVAVQNSVRVDPFSEPEPDVVLLAYRDDFYTTRIPQPADVLLLVEVGDSSAAFDRRVKRLLYARTGIAEVWLIDLTAGVITVHRGPGADGYAEEATVRPGMRLAPAAFPEDWIEVGEIIG